MAVHIPYFMWILAAALGVSFLTVYLRRKYRPVPANARRQTFSTNQDDTCIICCDHAIEAHFEPCGHSVMCDSCTTMYLRYDNKCPYCRCVIQRRTKL